MLIYLASRLIPTVVLPLSLLSYASVLGILAILLVVAIIFIDGLSKYDTPGSFWSPAVTSIGVDDVSHLGLSFGLFMAGVCRFCLFVNGAYKLTGTENGQFSGHAVIPVLSANMIDPQHFDQMINWAFVSPQLETFPCELMNFQIVATSIYAVVGAAGYMMFGNSVSDEVSV